MEIHELMVIPGPIATGKTALAVSYHLINILESVDFGHEPDLLLKTS
ncbi:hypothetical protein SDC9_62289 [bioreactor metagenome]|uniref:Uncharacterized protein n=1 Tax=bioreactor metagenome TaxID=1076179 RepID=A0A644XI93_9ZZZZ